MLDFTGSTNPVYTSLGEIAKIFTSTSEKRKETGPTNPCSNEKEPEIFASYERQGSTHPSPPIQRTVGDQHRPFVENAQLGKFIPELFPPPLKAESYNNDVWLPLYESSLRSYAGAQRKGIRDEHPEAQDAHSHVLSALQAPFFLAHATPIPESTRREIAFLANSSPNEVIFFWKRQLAALERLVHAQKGMSAEWLAARPPELRHLAPANALLFDFPMRRFNLGGRRRIAQLIHGFPITGVPSQDSTYPVNEKVSLPDMKHDEPFISISQRFRERASGRLAPAALELWSEPLQQHKEGWLHAPLCLSDDGRALNDQGEVLNLAFRFSAPQGGKNRACDVFATLPPIGQRM